MPRKLLLKIQIKELAVRLSQTFNFLMNLRVEEPLATNIQFPKIPSILSESIIYHLLSENRLLLGIDIKSVCFGGRIADIIATTSQLEELKVEVKATGTNAFEYFGEKDVNSDILVWVHFGDFFISAGNTGIEIFVIQEPSRFFTEPVKLRLRNLVAKVGNEMQLLRLDIKEL